MSTALAWLLAGLGILDPAAPMPPPVAPTSPTVVDEPPAPAEAPAALDAPATATDDYQRPPPPAPLAAPATAPTHPAPSVSSAPVRPAVAAQRDVATRRSTTDGDGFRPTIPFALASGVGVAGAALGGATAGSGAEPGMQTFSAVAFGIGAAGLATAGVLLIVGSDHERATEVAVSPAAAHVRRAF